MAFRLPRLPVNWREQPALFERYWDEAMTRIEETLNAILSIPAIEAALAAVDAKADDALADAAAAQDTATDAATAVNSVASETSLVNSYVVVDLAPTIEADDLGNITIQDHFRVYGDGPTVSVTGAGFFAGAASGDVVRIYYIQPSRAGGSVTYLFTTDPADPPAQSGSTHVVGSVRMPNVGTAAGVTVPPPGFTVTP